MAEATATWLFIQPISCCCCCCRSIQYFSSSEAFSIRAVGRTLSLGRYSDAAKVLCGGLSYFRTTAGSAHWTPGKASCVCGSHLSFLITGQQHSMIPYTESEFVPNRTCSTDITCAELYTYSSRRGTSHASLPSVIIVCIAQIYVYSYVTQLTCHLPQVQICPFRE